MQYSIVPFSDVDLEDRIDAEYFQPTYLEIEKKLASAESIPLREFCTITGSAFYPAATHLYEFGNLPFIRCVDCIPYPIITKRQDNLFEKIPIDFANEHRNIKRLKAGEIVITKVGTPCFASIIHDLADVALSRTVLGLKSIERINPYYLVAFLRSKYGFSQLYRERELTIQYQLTLERVGNILIHKPLPEIENAIADTLIQHEDCKRRSVETFDCAQNLLLSELGLLDWQPRHQLAFVKNYSDTVESERFDAEYFQPKYEEIIEAIQAYPGGWKPLGDLVSMKKCVEVGSGEYMNEGVPFVRVSNLGPHEITEEKYISHELYNRLKKHQPKKGEILLSKDGSPGIAHYLRETPKKMIPSGGILRLSPKSDTVNEDYLTLVLNSVLTKQQIIRDVGGSIILHWRPDQVKKLAVPILNKDKQQEIQTMVQESFDLRKRSKHLLECAKRAVEIAIEQDEDKAQAWLGEQTR
ncbi:MAG: restriction endonuclease subunit S [Candidatus Pacebacteria bacterium]|nr:restriction endonuclease subunit S [Candidatus Paceibacterota bacterium]